MDAYNKLQKESKEAIKKLSLKLDRKDKDLEKLEKESKTSLDQLQDKLKDKEEIIKDLESNIKAKNSSNEKLREEYNEIKSLYESKTQMITSLQKENEGNIMKLKN